MTQLPKARGIARRQLELGAEHPAEADEGPGPDHAAEPGEYEELEQRHPDDTGQRRRRRVEAGHEFGKQERAGAVTAEGVLGAPDARVGFEEDPAEPAENAAAADAADPVPDRIAHQRGQRGGGEDERQAQPTVSGQGAAGQKERHGRERQPDLLGEHPTEDDQVAVPDENVDDSVHYAPAGYQVDPIPGSPTIAAPRGAQEKFSLT